MPSHSAAKVSYLSAATGMQPADGAGWCTGRPAFAETTFCQQRPPKIVGMKVCLLILVCSAQLIVLLFVLGGGGVVLQGGCNIQLPGRASTNGLNQNEEHVKLRPNISAPGRVDEQHTEVASNAQLARAAKQSRGMTQSLQSTGQPADKRSERTTYSSRVAVPTAAMVASTKTRLGQGQADGPTPKATPSADAGISVLLIVKTGPHYFERRQVTRKHWFNRCRQGKWFTEGKTLRPGEREIFKQVSIECLFLAGKSKNRDVMAQLEAEVRENRDIVVAPFLDSYDSMTAKTQWVMLWSLLRDKRSHYVMLVDDDAYVVFGNLVPWLLRQPRSEFYAGHQHFNRNVVHCDRDPKNPNCIDSMIFKPNRYPPFASGFAYIVSRDVAARSVLQVLAHSSKQKLPGNIEDAMLGVLLTSSGIRLVDVPGFVHWTDEHGQCPAQTKILVIGNVPGVALAQFALNENHGRALC